MRDAFCHAFLTLVTISSESQQNKGDTTRHGQLISAFINWYKSGQH